MSEGEGEGSNATDGDDAEDDTQFRDKLQEEKDKQENVLRLWRRKSIWGAMSQEKEREEETDEHGYAAAVTTTVTALRASCWRLSSWAGGVLTVNWTTFAELVDAVLPAEVAGTRELTGETADRIFASVLLGVRRELPEPYRSWSRTPRGAKGCWGPVVS